MLMLWYPGLAYGGVVNGVVGDTLLEMDALIKLVEVQVGIPTHN